MGNPLDGGWVRETGEKEKPKAAWELIEDEINKSLGLEAPSSKSRNKRYSSELIDVQAEKREEERRKKLLRISKRLEKDRGSNSFEERKGGSALFEN